MGCPSSVEYRVFSGDGGGGKEYNFDTEHFHVMYALADYKLLKPQHVNNTIRTYL